MFSEEFPADFTAELPADCSQKSFMRICTYFRQQTDSKNRRKISPTKVLAGNQNSYIAGNKDPNPQVIKRFLVVEVKRRFAIAYFITMMIILIIPSTL
jgi:hypothetical protein